MISTPLSRLIFSLTKTQALKRVRKTIVLVISTSLSGQLMKPRPPIRASPLALNMCPPSHKTCKLKVKRKTTFKKLLTISNLS